LAKLKLQEPRAGGSAAVNECGYELPVLRCVQGLVGEIAARVRRVDGSLGDIAIRFDLDSDSYFDVALNSVNDLSWYVGQSLVRNRSLDDDTFGEFGRWCWCR
jgi:hypothetical protein